MSRTFNEEQPLKVPLRGFASVRPCFNADGKLELRRIVVLATDGPSAAHMIRDVVASAFQRYAPRAGSFGDDASRRRRRRKRRDAGPVAFEEES